MNICNARLHSSMKQSRRLLFFVCQLFPSTPDWSVVILGTKRALVPLQTFIESGCESLRMQGGCSAAELWPSCGEAKIKENFPAGCNTGSESKEHEMLLQKSQKNNRRLVNFRKLPVNVSRFWTVFMTVAQIYLQFQSKLCSVFLTVQELLTIEPPEKMSNYKINISVHDIFTLFSPLYLSNLKLIDGAVDQQLLCLAR